ncbi:MAG TPA: DUF488 family protein [Candidatus Anoxymicrobiaceae bacterium]
MIRIERIYTKTTGDGGYRILVDRLWPRGVRKENVDLWLKEVAPSTELRKWYGHEPDKWPDFKKKYFAELKDHQDEVQQILGLAQTKDVVLLYGSKEEKLNNAAALKEYLGRRLKK